MSRSALVEGKNPQTAIARAKREWECIADALPQVLCLLDRSGRILRSNRVVEQWSIGAVREVLGLDLHAMLHAKCAESACELRASLQEAWSGLALGGKADFETIDSTLGRAIRVEMKLLPGSEDDGAKSGNHAMCMISDITQLRIAQEGQRILRQELELRVQDRTHELMKAVRGLRAEVTRREMAETSLRTSRNELSRLSEELMRAQESERKRIAQDLHDAVGQSLSAIKYSLERAILMLATPQLGSPLKVMNKTVEHVQHTIDEVRTISENLRPALLDGLGAVSAIRWLCREWSEVFGSTDIEIQLHVTDAEIQEPLGTTLFRTVQESLNNVARHAKASRVSLSVSRESDRLRLEIADNGIGFEPDGNAFRRGHGLTGIRERAANTGGEFFLTSYPGGGVQLTMSWPIQLESNPGEVALCAS